VATPPALSVDRPRSAGVRSASRRTATSRQNEILDELEAVFLAQGFRHLTVGDLVSQLRCSRRTLYNLAPSREELILLVIERLLQRMGAEAYGLATAEVDPGEAISVYINTAVAPLRFAQPAFIEDIETYLPARQLYDHHVEIALRVLGRFVRDGVSAGTFRDLHPALVAEMISGAVLRILRPDVLARTGVTWSQALVELGELVRNGLARPPASGGRD
jgi:AcrR family transcriptional regulator